MRLKPRGTQLSYEPLELGCIVGVEGFAEMLPPLIFRAANTGPGAGFVWGGNRIVQVEQARRPILKMGLPSAPGGPGLGEGAGDGACGPRPY